MSNCKICLENLAIQKNSHIIPSFLIAMVTSYDSSYKRGKEILFHIDKFRTKVYTGELPSTEYDRLFNVEELTQERIENELRKNTVAEDFIFCRDCEKKLSTYLESPYSSFLFRGAKIDIEIPFIFWISVIWRMSIVGNYGFKLPTNIEQKMHRILHNYFQSKDNGTVYELDTSIKYKMLLCKDFCKVQNGYIYAEYDTNTQLLTISIGDICLCFILSDEVLPENYSFFGLEEYIKNAPINTKDKQEEHLHIPIEDYQKAVKDFIHFATKQKLKGEYELLDAIWMKLHLFGYMPMRMKDLFLNMLYDDTIKIGERHTAERYVAIFNHLLNHIYLWY